MEEKRRKRPRRFCKRFKRCLEHDNAITLTDAEVADIIFDRIERVAEGTIYAGPLKEPPDGCLIEIPDERRMGAKFCSRYCVDRDWYEVNRTPGARERKDRRMNIYKRERENAALYERVAKKIRQAAGAIPPHVRGSETSLLAALDEIPIRETDALRILALFEDREQPIASGVPRGLIDDEIEVYFGMRHQTASARRRDLERAGLVEKATYADGSPRRRSTRASRRAQVYILSNDGRRLIAECKGGSP